MGQSYIGIKGSNGVAVRIDVARNITNMGSKIRAGYILVYSKYSTRRKKALSRKYSLIEDLRSVLKEINENGDAEIAPSEIKLIKNKIDAIKSEIQNGTIKPEVLAYERPGWIRYDDIDTEREVLAFEDFIFTVKSRQFNEVQDNQGLDQSITEIEAQLAEMKNSQIIDNKTSLGNNAFGIEVPYNTKIEGIENYENAFCYGNKALKKNVNWQEVHEFRIDPNLSENLSQYLQGKPKAQIIMASMLNGLVYQALDIDANNEARKDERTLLSVTGEDGQGKSFATKAFKKFMFGNANSVSNDTTDSAMDSILKASGIEAVIYDDISTEKRARNEWIRKIFSLANPTGRINKNAEKETIYSQVMISCEIGSRLTKFIKEDKANEKGSKARLFELHIQANDICAKSENINDVEAMLMKTNAGVLKVYESLVNNQWGISEIVASYKSIEEMLRDKMSKALDDEVEDYTASVNRYASKLAVYATSVAMTSNTFGINSTTQRNAVLDTLVKTIKDMEDYLNKEDDLCLEYDEVEIKQAFGMLIDVLNYLNKYSDYVADTPSDYSDMRHIATLATAHSGSPNAPYDKIWIEKKYLENLITAAEKEGALREEREREKEAEKKAAEIERELANNSSEALEKFKLKIEEIEQRYKEQEKQEENDKTKYKFSPDKYVLHKADKKLSEQHKKIIKKLQIMGIHRNEDDGRIIEAPKDNKLYCKKKINGAYDQNVLVINYEGLLDRLLDELDNKNKYFVDSRSISYKFVDDADLTEEQLELKAAELEEEKARMKKEAESIK